MGECNGDSVGEGRTLIERYTASLRTDPAMSWWFFAKDAEMAIRKGATWKYQHGIERIKEYFQEVPLSGWTWVEFHEEIGSTHLVQLRLIDALNLETSVHLIQFKAEQGKFKWFQAVVL